MGMQTITRKAYAKINLGLDVLCRRPDGYHEVKMVMQTVDIYDILTFSACKEPGIRLAIEGCDLPADKNNLIYRAAELVMSKYGMESLPNTGDRKEQAAGSDITACGVEITLKKQIPIAAGMAGGSTDAAAVFHGLNELFALGMTEEDMCRLGVQIGADVPYCIMGGTALAEGIGERLTRLPPPPDVHLAVAKPDISVSTKFVYENLHADRLKKHPDIDGMAEALRKSNLDGILTRMENVLETVTVREYPVIAQIKEVMCKAGAENALMSGSGPTVFGIFRDKECACAATAAVRRQGLAEQVFVTKFRNRE